MENQFSLNYNGNKFNCEVDKDGLVWIIQDNEMKSNNGQVRPAKNMEEAKEIAKLMLYSMGY